MESSDSTSDKSCLPPILDLLSQNPYEVIEKTPLVFPAALRLLDLLWQSPVEYKSILNKVKTSKNFWKNFTKLLFNNQNGGTLEKEDFENSREIEIQCSIYESKSLILRVLTSEMHHFLFEAKRTSSENISKKNQERFEKAGEISTVLKQIVEEETLLSWLQGIRTASSDDEHELKFKQLLQLRFPDLPETSLRPLYWDLLYSVRRIYGSKYIYASSLLEEIEELERCATIVNCSWSFSDASLLLVRSWKHFLEVSTSHYSPLMKFFEEKSSNGGSNLLFNLLVSISDELGSEKHVGIAAHTLRSELSSLFLSLVEKWIELNSKLSNEEKRKEKYFETIELIERIQNSMESGSLIFMMPSSNSVGELDALQTIVYPLFASLVLLFRNGKKLGPSGISKETIPLSTTQTPLKKRDLKIKSPASSPFDKSFLSTLSPSLRATQKPEARMGDVCLQLLSFLSNTLAQLIETERSRIFSPSTQSSKKIKFEKAITSSSPVSTSTNLNPSTSKPFSSIDQNSNALVQVVNQSSLQAPSKSMKPTKSTKSTNPNDMEEDENKSVVPKNQTKIMSVTLSLLIEISKTTSSTSRQDLWLQVLQKQNLLPTLVRLLAIYISAIVSSTLPPDELEVVNTNTDGILHLFLYISSTPQGAKFLSSSELLSLICNNSLTPNLQNGSVEPYLPSGEPNHDHLIWCSFLGILTNCLQYNDYSTPVLDQTLYFLSIYSFQLSKCLNTIAPFPFQLTERGLIELDRTTCLLYRVIHSLQNTPNGASLSLLNPPLTSVLGRTPANTIKLLQRFSTATMLIIHRFVFLFNRPNTLSTWTKASSRREKERSLPPTPPTTTTNPSTSTSATSTTSTTNSNTTPSSPFLFGIKEAMLGILSNSLLSYQMISRSTETLYKQQNEWPFYVCELFSPSKEPPSLRSLFDCLSLLSNFLKKLLPQSSSRPEFDIVPPTTKTQTPFFFPVPQTPTEKEKKTETETEHLDQDSHYKHDSKLDICFLLSAIESCLCILVSHISLYTFSPNVDNRIKQEIYSQMPADLVTFIDLISFIDSLLWIKIYFIYDYNL
mgnify:CR=1 FL=1